MAYAATIEQDALIELVEFRADRLTVDGQVLGKQKQEIYAELENSSRKILQRARREIAFHAAKDGAANMTITAAAAKITVPVPKDFLRFIRMELSNLDVPISRLSEMTPELERLQAGTYSKAHAARPEAILVPSSGEEKLSIEVYPGDASASLVSFFYLPETPPEELPSELKDGLVYDATGTILLSVREPEAASVAMQKANEALAGLLVGAE